MKKLLLLPLILLTACGYTFSNVNLAGNIDLDGNQPRILAFGASNTGGQGTGNDARRFAYRRGLQQTLGIGTYDLVGDFTDPDISDAVAQNYDLDHSGIGGQDTATLEARLLNVINTYMPGEIPGDVVILDTGLNDSCLDSAGDRNGARDNYIDMINIVQAAKPNAIIVATVHTPTKTATSSCIVAPSYADVSLFRDAVLPALATEQSTNDNLRVLDLWNYYVTDAPCGGGNGDNCLFDTAHDTETGYTLKGVKIANCITNPGSTTYCTP